MKQYSKKQKLELQPASVLWNMYKPENAPFRFKAKTESEARQWQKKTRAALSKVLGCDLICPAALKADLLDTVDKGDYSRIKLLLRTTNHSLMPVYMLVPKGLKVPAKTILAFHGHGYGVKDIIGMWEDGTERSEPDGPHKDFAIELCKRGMIVVAPEIACFGERQTDFSYIDKSIGQPEPLWPATCTHSANLANHLGISILGFRIFEMRRLLDYLQSRKECDPNRIGVMGISGGGMLAFFLTAIELRIKACVISGYFSTFKDSILSLGHCPCNFVAGLGQFGEMCDLAGLIAPRPMLIEAGSRDPIFPIQSVKQSFIRSKKIYSIWKSSNLEKDFFDGRHQISGVKSYSFILNRLA